MYPGRNIGVSDYLINACPRVMRFFYHGNGEGWICITTCLREGDNGLRAGVI